MVTMDDCLNEAIMVLTSEPVRKNVPKNILKGCKGAVIAHTEEVSLVIGAGSGKGILIKHNEDGTWGPPAALEMVFRGVGANIGMATKHVLLVPMTDEALEKLTTNDKLTVSADLGVAVGPGPERSVGMTGMSPIYSYTFQQGLVLQAGITGTQISFPKAANETFYGAGKTVQDIVLGDGAVTVPEGNASLDALYAKLDEATKEEGE